MSDLIDRQAAIDATWEEPTYTDPINVLTEVRDRIKMLPSAEAIPVSWIKERIENAINAKQTLIAQMWLELIDGYMREKNERLD